MCCCCQAVLFFTVRESLFQIICNKTSYLLCFLLYIATVLRTLQRKVSSLNCFMSLSSYYHRKPPVYMHPFYIRSNFYFTASWVHSVLTSLRILMSLLDLIRTSCSKLCLVSLIIFQIVWCLFYHTIIANHLFRWISFIFRPTSFSQHNWSSVYSVLTSLHILVSVLDLIRTSCSILYFVSEKIINWHFDFV